ncbi:MAG: hydroxymethylbilane synthase [Beijerinckiaceae bacterium]
MKQPLLRIGTRGSPLALAQAHETRARLADALQEHEDRFKIVIIQTTGDQIQDRALSESGGKGLFTKEIDEAQLAGRVDICVHSGKDLPTTLPDGLMEAGYLEREDPRDAFIALKGFTLETLPAGATVGTASLRRQAMVLNRRPDLKVELLRGNVQTRLAKLKAGTVQGTILAMAGLNRLNLAHEATSILETDAFLPAVAQGAIGLVVRSNDRKILSAARTIVHQDTTTCVAAERAFLGVLDGSCKTPIAGHATIENGVIHLQGLVLSPDGKRLFRDEATGTDAKALGEMLGLRIKALLPADIFHKQGA